jgi:uncharacterized membrane protein YhaH (DUF805 family)
MNYMLMPLRRYADFDGRSRRKEFWLWQLFVALVSTVIIGSFMAMFLSAMYRVNERGGINWQESSSAESSSADSSFSDSDSVFSSGSEISYKGDFDPFMMMEEVGTTGWLLLALSFLWGLFIFIPNLAVTIRRLHDQDKSGWFYLLAFIPIANIVLLVFMFLEGTRGPNRFGPDPKGADVDRTFA